MGFLGSDNVKSPVVVGDALTMVQPLLDVCAEMSGGILVSEAVAMKVQSCIPVCAVDVINVGGTSMTLFELLPLPPGQTSSEYERRCTLYNEGFSAFLSFNFPAAMGYLTSFVRLQHPYIPLMQLRHAMRLVRLCVYFKTKRPTGQYLRRIDIDRFETESSVVDVPYSLAELCVVTVAEDAPQQRPFTHPSSGENLDEVQLKIMGNMHLSNRWFAKVLHEVSVLSALRHDNIVAYLGCAIAGKRMVIITEFVSGGSLQNVLENFGKIPMRSIKRYLREILHGICYLHAHGIVHRDLKPANVLLMIDGQCKLTDFGAAVAEGDDGDAVTTITLGTRGYMAPETRYGVYGKSGDIWSLGIMTYQLLTGRVVIEGSSSAGSSSRTSSNVGETRSQDSGKATRHTAPSLA